jgi:hypothetical protein
MIVVRFEGVPAYVPVRFDRCQTPFRVSLLACRAEPEKIIVTSTNQDVIGAPTGERVLVRSDARRQGLRRRRLGKGRSALLLATAPLVAGVMAGVTRAADVYTGGTGNWSDGTQWSLGVPPATGTVASLAPSVAGPVTVTYDVGTLSLASLTIAATTGATVTLGFGQPSGNLTIAGDEIVGGGGTTASANGAFNLTAGTNTVQSRLFIGSGTNGVGTFSLAAGGSLAISTDLYIGFEGGNGSFSQSGGSNIVSGDMLLGYSQVATGTAGSYNLSGGQLSVAGDEFVALNAAGTIFQSGGTHTVGGTLYMGDGGAALYSLSNGATLNVSADEFVGAGAGPGTFNQIGGTHTIGGSLTIGFGSGTYTLGGGTLAITGDENIGGPGLGVGTMAQNGGIHSVGGTIFIGASLPGQPSVYNMTGGTLNGHGLSNASTFNQTGGVATLNAVSGTGSATVGGGGGTALASVSAISQTGLTIGNGGTVQIRSGTTRITNDITALSIGTNGLLDLGNQFLRVDNTATPESAVRQYLKNAYNADPGSGIGNWLGTGGITSADAIASHNGASPDFRVSVGYVNGAYALDPLLAGPIPGQETLPTNRILIRPALYGDFNLDGKVDDTDLQIFSGLGQYNQPTDKFGWLGGDLNHDGKVDDTDLQIFSGAGNYNGPSYGAAAGGAKAAAATPKLTAGAQGATAATTSEGVNGDGVLDFVYNPATGDLTLHYDGDPRVTAAQPFQVVRLKSAGGHFIPANFNQTDFGAGVTATTAALNGTASGANSVPDGYDMGNVLPAGLAISDLTADLTLQWNVFGGGLTLKNGDIMLVPEPATIGLLGAGAMGLLARRRNRRRA